MEHSRPTQPTEEQLYSELSQIAAINSDFHNGTTEEMHFTLGTAYTTHPADIRNQKFDNTWPPRRASRSFQFSAHHTQHLDTSRSTKFHFGRELLLINIPLPAHIAAHNYDIDLTEASAQDRQDIIKQSGPSSRTSIITFTQDETLALTTREAVVYTSHNSEAFWHADSLPNDPEKTYENHSSTPLHLRSDAVRHLETITDISPQELATQELLGATIDMDKREEDLLTAFRILRGIKIALYRQFGVRLPAQ